MLELRPSNAYVWMNCWGQPVFVDSLNLPDTSSFHADEGSAAHELAAEVLDRGIDTAEEYFGDIITVGKHEIEIDKDMIRHVDTYVAAVQRAAYGNRLFVEQEIQCGKVLGRGRSGTGDAVIIPKRRIKPVEIHDLKYGQGVEVFAERNYQEMIYGAGVITSYPPLKKHKKLKLIIHQPRIKRAPDEWTVDIDKLMLFVEKVKRMVVKAENAKLFEGLVPGDKQCQFCAGKASCPALRKQVMSVFDNIDEYSGSVKLSSEPLRLSEDYKKLPLIELWAKAIKETVHNNLSQGMIIPDLKMVEGRKGNRKFSDQKKATKFLLSLRIPRRKLFNDSLKSPNQLEAVLSGGQFDKLTKTGLIERADGKSTVTLITDSRQEIIHSSVFEDLTGEL